jgi:hypothetical protein
MSNNFDVQMDKIVADTKEKMFAVVKNSIQEVVQDAQTPVAKGGLMRVDTGFLRSSGVAALNEIPSGPTEGRKRLPGETGVLPEYKYDEKNFLIPILSKMKIGDKFYFGWTAKYATIRELFDGFMEVAIMRWGEIVDEQIRRLKK